MTCAVIRKWVANPLRPLQRRKRRVDKLAGLMRCAFIPKVMVDMWLSDFCHDEVDEIGQWMDDGGRDAVA